MLIIIQENAYEDVCKMLAICSSVNTNKFISLKYRADSRFVPSQWETSLQSNVSHWLVANLESALK